VSDCAAEPVFDDTFREQLRALLTWRRDVRRFRREPLAAGTLERLIATACLAPSVGFSQPWRFVVVDDPQRRAAVRASFAQCNAAALAMQDGDDAARYARLKLAGLDDAPCQLAVFADLETARGRRLGRGTMPETLEYSVVIAVHSLWLAARAEGIGVGWVSILDPAAVAAALDVPGRWRLVAYLCIGTPEQADDTPALLRSGWEERAPAADVVLRR
jgi:5,6-dimethylbenzimidazole synthase